MLEVIDKGTVTEAHPVPLLFVHGGCHAAWCWDEHFLDFFADSGFRAVAPSFRGHGASPSPKPIAKLSIDDYRDDIRTVADDLGQPPVMIGHSTGGFVVQKYLEERSAPAAVLMASTPPSGILASSMRIWRRYPWRAMRANALGQSHEIFNSPERARDLLFNPSTPEDVVAACAARVERDSMRAVFLGQVRKLPKTDRIHTPILVLDGADDQMISNEEVRATARAYGTQAEFFTQMGHNMMVEPGWRAVAERIRDWLAEKGL